MQFLAGKTRCDVEDVPLLLSDFDEVFSDTKTNHKLLALDVSVKLDDYAAVDKHFSSIVTIEASLRSLANQYLDAMALQFIPESK